MSAFDINYWISQILMVYRIILIVYIFSSWVPPLRHSVVGELLAKISEPYLTPFRKIIPPIGGMLDISPIVALIALSFIEGGLNYLVNLLFG